MTMHGMRALIAMGWACVAPLACGAGHSDPPSPQPAAPAAAPATPTASREEPPPDPAPQPGCEPSSFSPALAAYDAIVDGLRFSLELQRDERGAWSPAAQLRMPLHHASSIRWENRALLDAETSARVRVEAV